MDSRHLSQLQNWKPLKARLEEALAQCHERGAFAAAPSPAQAWEPKVTMAAQSPPKKQGRAEQFGDKQLSAKQCLRPLFKPQFPSIDMRSN